MTELTLSPSSTSGETLDLPFPRFRRGTVLTVCGRCKDGVVREVGRMLHAGRVEQADDESAVYMASLSNRSNPKPCGMMPLEPPEELVLSDRLSSSSS